MAGSSGHTIVTTVEDTCPAIVEDYFAASIIQSMDLFEAVIDESISDLSDQDDDEHQYKKFAAEDDKITEDYVSPMTTNPGHSVELYWPLGNQYNPGTVSDLSYDHHSVNYDDCDTDSLSLQK